MVEQTSVDNPRWQFPSDWPLPGQYALALGVVVSALLFRWAMDAPLGGRFPFAFSFSILLPLALLVRPGPFLTAAVLGMFTCWYAFFPPRMSLAVEDATAAAVVGVFGLMLGATAGAAWLSDRARRERERNIREVRRSDHRLRVLTDATPALIAYVDAEMRYRFTNRTYREWFGGEGQELYGKHLRDVRGERAFEHVRPHVEEALRGREVQFETRVPYRHGGTRYVKAHYVPDIHDDGSVAGYYAMVTDITAGKTLEEELWRRGAQFETLLNQAPLGMYLVDADFRIAQVNPVAAPAFAQIPGGAIGWDFEEAVRIVWPPVLADELVRIFRHILETGEPHRMPETREVRADTGAVEFYEWEAHRITLPDGGFGVVAYFREISEQVRAREAIAESERRYRTLFESIDQGFAVIEIIFDERQQPVDYRFIEVNPAFEKHTGLTGPVGRTAREMVPDLEAHWFETYGRVALTGEPARFVNEARPMGQRWFDAYAFRIGDPADRRVALLFSDITARKRAEEAREVSEERLRIAQSAAQLGLHDYNVLTNTVDWDRRTRQVFGVGPDEPITYETWRNALHPDDLAAAEQAVAKSLDPAGDGVYFAQYRVVNPQDGATRWVEATGQATFIEGKPVRLVGTTQDITQRKEAERSLREADRRKDEFLATLAHELRNPLAAIRMALGIIDGDFDERSVAEMAAIIDRQSAQLVRLIDDLLDVGRISRGKIVLRKRPVDVLALVQQAVDDVRPVANDKGLRLSIHPPEPADGDDGRITTMADPVRLSQVVNNLLHNACKFTEPGGAIRVTLERLDGEVIVRVADTGIGIAPDQLPRIFDMFEQAGRSRADDFGGLGIGLSISRSMIELHGGRIEARSDGPGRGSEFAVHVPEAEAAWPEPSLSDASAPGEAPERPASPRRILVADDNRDALRAVARVLTRRGHDVRIAADGIEALEMLAASQPDVALLDIGMPGMDGYELARRIRREPWGEGLYLVAMTGWGQDRDKQLAREAGFDLHLTKPVDPDLLDELIARESRTAAPAPLV